MWENNKPTHIVLIFKNLIPTPYSLIHFTLFPHTILNFFPYHFSFFSNTVFQLCIFSPFMFDFQLLHLWISISSFMILQFFNYGFSTSSFVVFKFFICGFSTSLAKHFRKGSWKFMEGSLKIRCRGWNCDGKSQLDLINLHWDF